MDVQTNEPIIQGVPQRDSVVSKYSYKGSPLLRKAITRKIDPKIRTVQKRLAAVRKLNLEEETMDNHSDEEPRVDTLEEEKNDHARVLPTMSNDATENSDIVGVGVRASDGSKEVPVPGRGRRDIKKWKKARQEKAKREKARSRKERRSRSRSRGRRKNGWSEDSYDEELDAIGGLFDYFGGNEDLYSEYTEETGSTNGDFIGHMFSDSKRGRDRVDIPELLMEQFGCLEEYNEADERNAARGKGAKKKSSTQSKDEGKSVPEKVIINDQADDDERGIKSTLTFDYVPESACSERLHIIEQLSHKFVDMVCDAWDKEPSDETTKTMGDIEVQSQAAFSVISAASEKSYKKLTAASEQGFKTLSSASEKGYQTLKALVEQARVAARKGNDETKEDDGVKVADDNVVIMRSGSGVETGQVKVDASTDDEMAKMKVYLSNVHNGFMEAIKSPAGMQGALPCKSPVNCPDDEAAIQDSEPCKLPVTFPENGETTQSETPALADQIVDDAGGADDVEAEPVLVDKFVDELESGISIPSCTSKLEDDAQESEDNSAHDIEKPNKKDQNLDEPEEHVENTNSKDSENVQKEDQNAEREGTIDELGTKLDEKATLKTPETSPGSSPASTPARNSSKNKKVKTPKKGKNPLKRIFRILRPAKIDSKFKQMDVSDVDSSKQQISSEERSEAPPILLKLKHNETGEDVPSPKKALPKVIIRPLSEDMDDTEKPEAPDSGRATLTTEGGASSPRLSVPRENPNPRNRHKKATDEGNPKPTQSTPKKVAEDKKDKVATWDSPMYKDDLANNESAWYKKFVEWDSEVPAEGAQEEIVAGEEAQGSKMSRESLRPENRQQSNDALNDSSSNEQELHQVRSPLTGAEERECATGHDDKSGGQTWYKEFSEWDQGGAASPLGERNRSTDSNSSPADVSRFDHATQSTEQGQKERVDQIIGGTSDGPHTAGEF